jgi:hypothetical protein
MNRPTRVCSITRRDLRVGVYSNNPGMLDACMKGSFTRYVPDYRCVPDSVADEPDDYEIWHVEELPLAISQQLEYRRLIIGGNLQDISYGEAIPYLAYSLLERAGMARGEATLHGASVTKNGAGILILGKSGSGKTSLALELCLNRGCSIMANDLTVIQQADGQLFLVAGTREFYVREQNIRKYQPALANRLEKGREGDAWWSRSTLYPDELGITVERGVVPIRRVLMIHVSAFGGAVAESPIDQRWARIYLYEAVSRYILRARLPALAGENDQHWLFTPSLDTEELHKQRVAIVNTIVSAQNYTTITGGLHEIAAYIEDQLQ